MKIKNFSVLLACLLLIFAAAVNAADDENKQAQAANIKAIDWSKLTELLPDKVEGMEVGDPDGGIMEMSDPADPQSKFSYSSSARTYSSGEKEITLTIMDSNLNQFILMPFTMSFEFDSPEASVKTIQLGEQPAKMFCDKEEGKITRVQIMALVGGRLLVVAEGNEGTSADDVTNLIKMIDLEAAAGLVK